MLQNAAYLRDRDASSVPIYHDDDYFLDLPERAFFVGGGPSFSEVPASVDVEEGEVGTSFAGDFSIWNV